MHQRLCTWSRAVSALCLSWPMSSCLGRPPHVASDLAGTVRAQSSQAAEETLVLLGELRPAVEALLGASEDVSLEVWVRDREREPGPCKGFTERWPDASAVITLLDTGEVRNTLAHELVHATRPRVLRSLPPLLEEGLAEWVAARLAPADARSRVSEHVNVAAYFDAMRLSLEVPGEAEGAAPRTLEVEIRLGEPDVLSPEELFACCDHAEFRERMAEADSLRSTRFYSLAGLCVARIVEREGLDGLRRLAERAESSGLSCVPWPWIARASGLERREDWLAAAWSRLTAEDVRVLAEFQPGLVVGPLASTCASFVQPQFPGATGPELLERSRARLVFAAGDSLPLAELEPLVEALADASSSPRAPLPR